MHLGLRELIPLKTNKNSAPSKNGIGRSQILREHTSIFLDRLVEDYNNTTQFTSLLALLKMKTVRNRTNPKTGKICTASIVRSSVRNPTSP